MITMAEQMEGGKPLLEQNSDGLKQLLIDGTGSTEATVMIRYFEVAVKFALISEFSMDTFAKEAIK